jgi:Nitrile hydratase, alpha chain
MAELDEGRDQVEREIVDRASSDQEFRRQLISDPRATLESELGTALPQGVEVSVLEETSSHYYLVLPPEGVAAGTELSDEALASVAGGGSGNSWNDTSCVGTLRPC